VHCKGRQHVRRSIGVKLDKDLIREVLLAGEPHPDPSASHIPLNLPEHDAEVVSYHVMLLDEGGFLKAMDVSEKSQLEWFPPAWHLCGSWRRPRSRRSSGCPEPARSPPSPPLGLPTLVALADDRAQLRFLEFFAASIRNPHTRRAYARATGEFLGGAQHAG